MSPSQSSSAAPSHDSACGVIAPSHGPHSDPVAVATTRRNAALNGLARFIKAEIADHVPPRDSVACGPGHDLIVANILARPLVMLAPDIARALAPGGVAVLSGILGQQQRAVASAYRARGMALAGRIVLGEWPTLILRARPLI